MAVNDNAISKKYERACSKGVTVAAVMSEVLMIISFILLCDSLMDRFQVQTVLASHVPLEFAIITVCALQYIIMIIEMMARYRDKWNGLTIPIVFLPGGIILRSLFMLTLEIFVISLKLLVYFISILIAFVFQIFRVKDNVIAMYSVDIVDHILEYAEINVNKIYNSLYYTKINANSSVFTSLFNGSLSFWCMNH